MQDRICKLRSVRVQPLVGFRVLSLLGEHDAFGFALCGSESERAGSGSSEVGWVVGDVAAGADVLEC